MTEPLIYTSKGNVPIDTLDYEHYFEDHLDIKVAFTFNDGALAPIIDKDGGMVFVEKYYDKETHELVKESRHIYKFKGLETNPAAGEMA